MGWAHSITVAHRAQDDVAIICRNTTEAINHLAYRMNLEPADVVVTTVVEHHANLLPWRRVASLRFVECGEDGTFSDHAVRLALDAEPRPTLLAVTGASNITGWLPPLAEIILDAHERDIPVLVDAAQLAPRASPQTRHNAVRAGRPPSPALGNCHSRRWASSPSITSHRSQRSHRACIRSVAVESSACAPRPLVMVRP
jgi:cysteine sulfinate desulfinase/cysteine desulfurase-like protein